MSDTGFRKPFSVWAAMRRASDVLWRHSVKPVALGALVTGVIFGGSMVILSLAAGIIMKNTQSPGPPPSWIVGVLALSLLALSAVCAAVLAAYAADCQQTRNKTTFTGAWLALWRHLPMVLLITIAQAFLTALGSLLLIVPGVFISLIIGLAVSARVSEGLGLIAAFRRSADISRFNRWRLLGYSLLAGIAVVVLAVLGGGAVTVILEMMSNGGGGADSSWIFALFAGLTALVVITTYWSFVTYLIGLAPAVAFAELRAGKEPSAVSDVFA